ncbi:MAG: N-acetyltransferase [Roseiarcus sp.]
MLIRPERESEFPAIYELVRVGFTTAKVANGDEQNFVDRLRSGDGYIPELALVAEDDGELVGHIMLTRTFVSTAEAPRPVLLLAPLCVVLKRRKQGLGARLIQDALSRARRLGHAAVVLVGDPAYYSRFGFKPCASFGIANANGIPDRHVMALELAPGALANASGIVLFQT